MDEVDISAGAKRQGPGQEEVICSFGWDSIYIYLSLPPLVRNGAVLHSRKM